MKRAAITGAILLSLPAAHAAECQVRVILEGGRVIEADGARTEGGVTYLALGGGEIGFPEAQVLRVDPCLEGRRPDRADAERPRGPRRRPTPSDTPDPRPTTPPAEPEGEARSRDAVAARDDAAEGSLDGEPAAPLSPLADPEAALNYLRQRVARWDPESDFTGADANLDRARYDQVAETLRYRIPRWEPASGFLEEDAVRGLVRDEGALDVLRRDIPRWRPESTFLVDDDLLDRSGN